MPKIISLEKKKRLYKVVFDDERTIYVTEDTIVRFFCQKVLCLKTLKLRTLLTLLKYR